MADLSQLSTEDLVALRSGDLSKVSTQGLMALRPQKNYKAMSQPVPVDPTAEMSQGQRFTAGVGKAFYDIGSGLGRFVGMGETPEELTNRRELDRPLMSTGAGMAGNVAGAATAYAPLALLPGANTVAGATALGGAVGLTQPSTGLGESLTNAATGAALSGGVQAAATPAVWAGKKLRNFVDPWLPGGIDRAVGRTAREAAGPDQQAIIAELKRARQIVPGSPVTAGEAAAPVGRAEFSGLQEVIKGRMPTEYERIAQSQNAARVAALRSVGQDEAALSGAMRQRAANAKANYGYVEGAVVPRDPQLDAVLSNPALAPALRRAETLSAARNAPVQKGQWTVDQLQDVKMAIDDAVRNPETFGIGASEARALGALQEKLIARLRDLSPAWNIARNAYARESRPINQMQIGQFLEGKLTPALSDLGATASQRSGVYAQALRDAPKTIKSATGQTMYDDLGAALESSQLRGVTGVGEDLARTAVHQRLASAGSQKARELVGQISPALPAAGMFKPEYSVLRALSNRLAGRIEGKAADRLAQAMQNPQELARLMEGMAPKQRAALVEAIRRAKNPAIGVMTYEVEQGNQP